MQQRAPAAHRQLVNPACDEPVRHVERAVPLVPRLEIRGQRRELVGRAQVEAALPRIGSEEPEALRPPFLDLRRQRVVARPPSVVRHQNEPELRVRHALHDRSRARRIETRDIEVAALRQLAAGAAGVFDFDQIM